MINYPIVVYISDDSHEILRHQKAYNATNFTN